MVNLPVFREPGRENSLPHTEKREVDVTVPEISEQDRAILRAAAKTRTHQATCPLCGFTVSSDQLACSNCGTALSPEEETQQLEEFVDPARYHRPWPIGQVFVQDQQAITFHINGRSLTLPANERMIIGRRSNSYASVEPEVALNDFGAEELGVSRLHLRLRRAGDMVYVTDLCSSNGSHLNGRPLAPHSNAILRNGDELRLGRLTIQVVFNPTNPPKQMPPGTGEK
ncbi:MAG TPA: FHA domain-containing protein [Aggregatilineales bacterium]|nr:FHA domain-containing protein [Aggregatilineales bacterium]